MPGPAATPRGSLGARFGDGVPDREEHADASGALRSDTVPERANMAWPSTVCAPAPSGELDRTGEGPIRGYCVVEGTGCLEDGTTGFRRVTSG